MLRQRSSAIVRLRPKRDSETFTTLEKRRWSEGLARFVVGTPRRPWCVAANRKGSR